MRIIATSSLFAALLFSASASAHPASDFEQRLNAARASGEVDLDEYFLQRLSYAFAPNEVDPLFMVEQARPLKDTTWLLAQYDRSRTQLRPETVAWIDEMLASPDADSVYDTTHFHFTYSLSGVNGVPSTDSDGNGVPDFVQNMGEYAEYCWTAEVNTMGFKAPYLAPANNNKMVVSFKNQNSYAFTQCPGGVCTIVMENDFAGFPEDDDPDGVVAGASKVTFAHEFKHASQYATSKWSEGGWVELDATWMEDMAYDYVNDYVRYINNTQSQVVTPTDPLDKGGAGSYYDAIWEHSMSQRFGLGIMVAFWNHRGSHQTENVETSYDTILKQYGSSLADQFEYDYFPRNYFTNVRTVGNLHYNDGAEMNAGPIVAGTLGTPISASLSHLSGRFYEFTSSGASTAPSISITTSSTAVLAGVAVAWNNGGGVTISNIKVSAGKGSATLGTTWSNVSKVAVIMSNGGTSTTSTSYRLTVN